LLRLVWHEHGAGYFSILCRRRLYKAKKSYSETMKPCVLYFSRTGNTKRMAEAIAESTKAPVFSIANSDPSVVEDFDMVILGTPVEGFRPAKETLAFVERLPKAEGKKAILFCTHALWKGSTFKILQRELSNKGYETILSVSKKGMKPDKPADFSDALGEIRKVIEK
jgi:flavodoxin